MVKHVNEGGPFECTSWLDLNYIRFMSSSFSSSSVTVRQDPQGSVSHSLSTAFIYLPTSLSVLIHSGRNFLL